MNRSRTAAGHAIISGHETLVERVQIVRCSPRTELDLFLLRFFPPKTQIANAEVQTHMNHFDLFFSFISRTSLIKTSAYKPSDLASRRSLTVTRITRTRATRTHGTHPDPHGHAPHLAP